MTKRKQNVEKSEDFVKKKFPNPPNIFPKYVGKYNHQ
jgi:hypothetical protein